MSKYIISTNYTYAELEFMGVIDTNFYEINDIDLTGAYALHKRPINVMQGDKFIGLAFSSEQSAQNYIDSLNAEYDGFL